jgi:aspartate-semialdehyde dehydrogenase
MENPTRRWPVAILGATGAVGQTFVACLTGHPWFEIAELAASERSAGRTYAEACRHWVSPKPMPAELADRVVVPCDPEFVQSKIVFSALDSSAADDIEPAFARAGAMVLSNAKSYRMETDVPLVIPEVNASHLDLLGVQRRRRAWTGAIVTNANCAATVATMALAPIHERFGLRQVFVVTMQAISGAGYPGVPSLDILGNVIPYIGDEEPKIEREINKMLGRYEHDSVRAAGFGVSAHANRVPTEHGHLVCLSVSLDRAGSADDVAAAIAEWRGEASVRGLPSAPERPVVLATHADRPQTRRDVWEGAGMSVTVGRVRPDPILDVKLVALGHNTIRGAAGGSVLNAELLAARGELAPA